MADAFLSTHSSIGHLTRQMPNTANWQYTINGKYAVISKYIGTSNTVNVPTTLSGLPVMLCRSNTTYNTGVFINNKNITSVNIPNGVKFFNNDSSYLFYQCSNLVSTNINASINTTNSVYMYSYCYKLTSPGNLPNSVYNASHTYSYCYNLVNAPCLPSSAYYANYIFAYCTNLKNTSSFDNTSSLSKVAYMNNAFRNCINLTTIPVLPNTVVNASYAFSLCTNLNSPGILPANLVYAQSMFYSCSALSQAPNIPANVINAYSMFQGCINIRGDMYVLSNKINNASNLLYNRNTSNRLNIHIPATGYNSTHNSYNTINSIYGSTANTYVQPL